MNHQPMTPQEALPAIRAALEAGRPCSLTVTGGSMLPFLRHKKDAVILVPPAPPYRRGDILFYLRGSGQCVLHRVHRVRKDGTLLLCGDAQKPLEPVHPSQVIATVSHIRRGQRLTDCRQPLLRCSVALWQLLRPLRPGLMACLMGLHRLLHTKR